MIEGSVRLWFNTLKYAAPQLIQQYQISKDPYQIIKLI